ncbi:MULTISPECIES: response regulator [Rhizobium/Agrobacterium group]|jgi:two-component system, response regulator PdtaR|uniref:DNA-binding NtrC family response regulator n=1 Tax=Rhizobium soli TaxID=424798 RepID=A0A7X0JH14_9HYPH|nr:MULTISPECIES: response regulator [Rhizobium/Agrobacterium group]KQQ36343.1 two-component system response regulator [Rhizobium sp. Leaf306]KQQ71092.1 two-component system response regulator [Rhizobium sp. Leaf321]MBB6507428.1 DNA-binding NtrC family response regulator [Rhizobium soli]MBD8651392.1 response regulator [Rhizobium sp. CFBP 13726]MBD8662329.1 response regulator [Rhizobium sp. CFBP 8752]
MKHHPILVVEDDGLIRMDLADVLSDSGFDVVEAANADQALALLEAGIPVKAMLTDIDMPGSMNGIKLANLTASRWPECRIIVISGRFSPDQGSLPQGARFLSKPISERQLSVALFELGLSSTI